MCMHAIMCALIRICTLVQQYAQTHSFCVCTHVHILHVRVYHTGHSYAYTTCTSVLILLSHTPQTHSLSAFFLVSFLSLNDSLLWPPRERGGLTKKGTQGCVCVCARAHACVRVRAYVRARAHTRESGGGVVPEGCLCWCMCMLL